VITAATTQQGVGRALIATALLGLLIYVIAENRVSKQSNLDSFMDAPNRKAAPNDEVFEGPRLDRWLTWALVLMTIVAISVPVYWLGEVGRQEGAIRGFDKRSVHRGEEAYFNTPNTKHGTPALNCQSCHGANAGGGVAPTAVKDYDENGIALKDASGKDLVRSVSWAAPRLSDVALRYKKGQLRNVLVYGRAPVMPAWGVAGGGPSTDQTIDDLIQYLRHLALEKNEEARKIYEEKWDETKNADTAFDFALNSLPIREQRQKESTEALAAAKKAAANDGKSDGQILFEMNCARCHTSGWSQGEPKPAGTGAFGPRLSTESLKIQFPNPADQAAFIKAGTEDNNKPYGTRGINGWESGGMPYFGNVLTDKQIDAIVEYERALHSTDSAGAVAASATTEEAKQ
jgi:mono/diheme cytochrome c family protein